MPDQTKVLAQSVDALDGYGALLQRFEMNSLSKIEQEVMYLATSRLNTCGYCMAAHTQIAVEAGMTKVDLKAARSGAMLSDARLAALQTMTCAIVSGKGRVPTDAVDTFVAQGFRKEQVFEILIGISARMLSNFFNEIAGAPLEPELEPYQWSPPIVAVLAKA